MIPIRSKSVSGANIDYHLYEEGEGNFVEPFYVYGEKAMTEASSKVPYLHEQIKAMYFIQETCWPLDIIFRFLHYFYKRDCFVALLPAYVFFSNGRISTLCPVYLVLACAAVITSLLKYTIGIPRPQWSIPDLKNVLVIETGWSWPSMHSTLSSCLSVASTIELVKESQGSGGMDVTKRYWIAAFMLNLVLTPISRIYYGCHWLWDVIAGTIIGSTVAILWSVTGVVEAFEDIFNNASNVDTDHISFVVGILVFVAFSAIVTYWIANNPFNDQARLMYWEKTLKKNTGKSVQLRPWSVAKYVWSTVVLVSLITSAYIAEVFIVHGPDSTKTRWGVYAVSLLIWIAAFLCLRKLRGVANSWAKQHDSPEAAKTLYRGILYGLYVPFSVITMELAAKNIFSSL